MRLTEYGRNPHTRKAYVQQPDLLMVGVDVSKAKHIACLGTRIGVRPQINLTTSCRSYKLSEYQCRCLVCQRLPPLVIST